MIIKSKKKHPMDNLTTPDYLKKLGEEIWKVKCNIDACATKKNRKCQRYISKKQNFLKQTKFKKTDVLWCNFPHSKNRYFIEHLSKIVENTGCRALLLTPINTLCSTYAENFILPFVEISKKMIIKGRHRFLDPKTLEPTKESSVNGYVIVFYDKNS